MGRALQETARRAFGLSLLALVGCAEPGWPASAATRYAGIYGGGPIYKSDTTSIPELNDSGFNELIVWSVHVDGSGNLNLNGEFPLTSNGVYIGNNTYPNFASDMAKLKKGNIKRITFSVGAGGVDDFGMIKSLVAAQGTGPTSILYRDFQALKAAIPSIDAIDFDDESTYDSDSSSRFAEMLGRLGYHVTISPYENQAYWRSLVSTINNVQPVLVDGVHLQVYSGGAKNHPCGTGPVRNLRSTSWKFGNVPLLPGLWDRDVSPEQAQTQWRRWAKQCRISGGFLWLYDEIAGKTYNGKTLAQNYAAAIGNGVRNTTATRARYRTPSNSKPVTRSAARP